jgi:hypothetical protein
LGFPCDFIPQIRVFPLNSTLSKVANLVNSRRFRETCELSTRPGHCKARRVMSGRAMDEIKLRLTEDHLSVWQQHTGARD